MGGSGGPFADMGGRGVDDGADVVVGGGGREEEADDDDDGGGGGGGSMPIPGRGWCIWWPLRCGEWGGGIGGIGGIGGRSATEEEEVEVGGW